MSWLDPVFDGTALDSPTLVLCRTSASVTAVRRCIARRGGVVGMTVITPSGLAASLAALDPPRAEPQADAAPHGALWVRVAGRPGLQRRLLELVETVRLGGLAGEDLPEDLAEVVRTAPVGRASLRQLLQLQDRARQAGARLGPEYARVFAIGFGGVGGLPEEAGPGGWLSSLLSALGAVRLVAPAREAGLGSVPALKVADVVAEARGVAARAAAWRDAGGALDEVLVLTANEVDADRIRGALSRAGLPTTDDGARGWHEHALHALLMRIQPWFEGGVSAEIDGNDLRILLQSRMLRGAWDGAAAAVAESTRPAMGAFADGVDEPLRLSRARVNRVLQATRRVRGTSAQWRASLAQVGASAGQPDWLRRQALVIEARLAVLEACRTGAAGGTPTLGDLHGFITSFGVRTRVEARLDVVAAGLLDALREARGRPVTRLQLEDTLAGAAGSGAVHDGVVSMALDDYDGRPAGLLLLTGLHARGIGRPPEPDPFVADPVLAAALGMRPGAAALDHRERLLAAAVRRADASVAFVAERSADGRASAAYLYLSSVHDGPDPVRLVPEDAPGGSFGLGAETPEWRDLSALEKRDERPPTGDLWRAPNEEAHLARMASLEWVRSGAAVEGFQPDDGPRGTLTDWTRVFDAAFPPALRPWCGDTTSSAPGSGLPTDHVLSASGSIEPLLHCRFQVFAKARLGLRETEELSEDLDSRDVGNAVHGAMAETGALRVPKAEVAGRRTAMVAQLRAGMAARMDAVAAPTAGLAASRDGLRDRWGAHFPAVAKKRVEELDAEGQGHKDAISEMKQLPEWVELRRGLELWFDHTSEPWIPMDRRSKLDGWLAGTLRWRSTGEDLASVPVSPLSPTKCGADLREWTAQDGVAEAVDALLLQYASLVRGAVTAAGPVIATAAEWPIRDPDEDAPLAVRFGEQVALVRGSVDRLFAYGDAEEQVVEVLDYKTGAGRESANKLAAAMKSGRKAQVPAYAVVVRAALRAGKGPPGFAASPVGWRLGYDHVKTTESPVVLDARRDEVSLDAVESLIETQLTRARGGDWLVLPHGDTCPALHERGHDHCPYGDVCRFRAHPGDIAALDDEDAPEESA